MEVNQLELENTLMWLYRNAVNGNTSTAIKIRKNLYIPGIRIINRKSKNIIADRCSVIGRRYNNIVPISNLFLYKSLYTANPTRQKANIFRTLFTIP